MRVATNHSLKARMQQLFRADRGDDPGGPATESSIASPDASERRAGSRVRRSLRVLCTLALGCLSPVVSTTIAWAQQTAQQTIANPVFMCGSGVAGQRQDKQRIFESVPTRPLAVSDDGRLLFALNAPASCLEIFEIGDRSLTLRSTVRVGIDPVAVAQRTATELWVVNHISDSVSIVRIDGTPRVAATLQVGDAPWDIVFADHGRNRGGATHNRRNRAFVSAAFRGQHHPQFKTQFLLLNRLDTSNGAPGEPKAHTWPSTTLSGSMERYP